MAKKNNASMGGILAVLGALVYLYVVFTWYSNATASAAAWSAVWSSSLIGAASFLAPFVVAFAVVGSISLFFMSIAAVGGMMSDSKMKDVLWKFITITGLALVIITFGTGIWFWAAVIGFILTYIGAASLEM